MPAWLFLHVCLECVLALDCRPIAVSRGVVHLSHRAQEASEDASFHSSALISKLKGERHCRPPPSSLRGNVTKVGALTVAAFVRTGLRDLTALRCGEPRRMLVMLQRKTSVSSDQLQYALQLHVAGVGEVYKMQQPRKRSQWLVQARFDGLLTLMTPIYPDKENLALLLNQACFCVETSLSACL